MMKLFKSPYVFGRKIENVWDVTDKELETLNEEQLRGLKGDIISLQDVYRELEPRFAKDIMRAVNINWMIRRIQKILNRFDLVKEL